jgi:hypothetical protein
MIHLLFKNQMQSMCYDFSIKICIIILKVYIYDVGANVTNEYCKVDKKHHNEIYESTYGNHKSHFVKAPICES